DAHRLKADPRHARAAARRREQPVAPLLGTVTELQDVLVALPSRGGGVHSQYQLDPVAAQSLGERLAERRGLMGEDPVGALVKHHLTAETAGDLRDLGARRP